jgi:hypothetical protein
MKVLFDCHLPFMLAQGGMQIQIEQSLAALEKIGVSVEPMSWCDETQSGDILRHFGRMPSYHVRAAQQKGRKVVVADWLTGQGSRSSARIKLQKLLSRAMVPLLRWTRRESDSKCGSASSRYSGYLRVPPWPAPLLMRLLFAWEKRLALKDLLRTGTSLFAVGVRPECCDTHK